MNAYELGIEIGTATKQASGAPILSRRPGDPGYIQPGTGMYPAGYNPNAGMLSEGTRGFVNGAWNGVKSMSNATADISSGIAQGVRDNHPTLAKGVHAAKGAVGNAAAWFKNKLMPPARSSPRSGSPQSTVPGARHGQPPRVRPVNKSKSDYFDRLGIKEY
jgi:hypothetical protein